MLLCVKAMHLHAMQSVIVCLMFVCIRCASCVVLCVNYAVYGVTAADGMIAAMQQAMLL